MRTFLAGLIVIVIGLVCAAGWGYGVYSKERYIQRCELDKLELEADTARLQAQIDELDATLKDAAGSEIPADQVKGMEARLESLVRQFDDQQEKEALMDQKITAGKEQTGLEFLLGGR